MKIKERTEIGLCDSLLVASTEEMEAIAIGVKGTNQRHASQQEDL